jgi:hypothetical protein
MDAPALLVDAEAARCAPRPTQLSSSMSSLSSIGHLRASSSDRSGG